MKISNTLLPIVLVSGNSEADVDGNTVHLAGCIWPETGVLGTKMGYADDPYARFDGLEQVGTDSPYSEGHEILRQCPTFCDFDGTNYVNCSGYGDDDSDDLSFVCGFKDGKNNRPAGRHYVFKTEGKNLALFFRTGRLDKYRPVPQQKLCPKPTVAIGDPESVCGDKPQIPTKDDVRHAQFTSWGANGLSVVCNDGARPIRANNYEQLNLVCDRQKPTQPYKWFHQSANSKLRPAGNKWIKGRFLCRFDHNVEEETSGEQPEGSGSESPDAAEVTL